MCCVLSRCDSSLAANLRYVHEQSRCVCGEDSLQFSVHREMFIHQNVHGGQIIDCYSLWFGCFRTNRDDRALRICQNLSTENSENIRNASVRANNDRALPDIRRERKPHDRKEQSQRSDPEMF